MNCPLHRHPSGQHALRIYLRVNNRCRYKCNHCQGTAKEGVCADYALDDIIGALAPFEPLQIKWYGGEPLLSPRLAEYVAITTDRGACNIVCTTMIPGDPLGSLAGRFVYQVEIHGVDRMEYKQHTGWDLFNDFHRNFHGLFDSGHLVEAIVVVTVDWRECLEPRIRWLNNYPIRHLRLFDDREAGASVFSRYSIQESEIVEMKQRVAEIQPTFPVTFPQSDKRDSARVLTISPVSDGSAFCDINGIKAESRDVFIKMLEGWNNSPDRGDMSE